MLIISFPFYSAVSAQFWWFIWASNTDKTQRKRWPGAHYKTWCNSPPEKLLNTSAVSETPEDLGSCKETKPFAFWMWQNYVYRFSCVHLKKIQPSSTQVILGCKHIFCLLTPQSESKKWKMYYTLGLKKKTLTVDHTEAKNSFLLSVGLVMHCANGSTAQLLEQMRGTQTVCMIPLLYCSDDCWDLRLWGWKRKTSLLPDSPLNENINTPIIPNWDQKSSEHF